jgi:hypothetical protein
VVAVAMNTSDPAKIARNAAAVDAVVPCEYWDEARAAGLIHPDYPM